MLTPVTARWLVHLADPEGVGTPRPSRPLRATDAKSLLNQAHRHAVLGSVLRNLDSAQDLGMPSALLAAATAQHHNDVGFNLVLRKHAHALQRAIASEKLPAMLVKGPVFARQLYPDPGLRRFTDIDLLIHPDAILAIEHILRDLGFVPAGKHSPGTVQPETKWLFRADHMQMVEVQTNLIHAASLRNGMWLSYADLATGDCDTEFQRPSTLMIVAAIHGAGHEFERLQHVADICQAARRLTGAVEEQRLTELLDRSRSRLATVTGLALAARMFGELRCLELANAIGPVQQAGLARSLMHPVVVRSSKHWTRPLHSWRRKLFRELLKANPTIRENAERNTPLG
ncbi:MAG: nucleotidyltransferase family protein [Tardiphaga sp.]|uniref:nucleotidyltransferase family protein n=1 Tax=Tardiphaga sp. TaxID=1926292 RepID=UPI001995C05C|nr:nucleotidyltransferase family protein [Tardiphaga sp.]MBC7582695.1 nucleotidyltransferase family protein [Tardiphaga sp.]